MEPNAPIKGWANLIFKQIHNQELSLNPYLLCGPPFVSAIGLLNPTFETLDTSLDHWVTHSFG